LTGFHDGPKFSIERIRVIVRLNFAGEFAKSFILRLILDLRTWGLLATVFRVVFVFVGSAEERPYDRSRKAGRFGVRKGEAQQRDDTPMATNPANATAPSTTTVNYLP
jgi:hypothetical protein